MQTECAVADAEKLRLRLPVVNSPKEKILVVEDEALLLFAVADELRDAGYEVLEARDADEAIELLEAEGNIRLIFTDIDMPGSMDGLRLSAVVRDRWPPVRIIVTSGKHQPEQGSLPTGGRFMSKPYVPASVIGTVRSMLA